MTDRTLIFEGWARDYMLGRMSEERLMQLLETDIEFDHWRTKQPPWVFSRLERS